MASDMDGIELSAYADGELDAARVSAFRVRVEADAALRRTLSSYRVLHEAAARLPVPGISEAASRKAWHAIAEMTTQITAADRRVFARLDQAAAALPAPAMSEVASGKAWRGIAERTSEVSSADRRAFARLDAAAAGMPAPQLSDETLERAWENIRLRTMQAGERSAVREVEPPLVNAQQWDSVWQGIREKTRHAAPEPGRAPPQAVTRVDFAKPRRRWFMAASLAAAAMFAVVVFTLRTPEEPMAMAEVPAALDDRYEVQVKYVEGQSAPVVCFFLKEDAKPDEGPRGNWRWLPD